jgi:hypothetical protein
MTSTYRMHSLALWATAENTDSGSSRRWATHREQEVSNKGRIGRQDHRT